jgi:hypothetical protein
MHNQSLNRNPSEGITCMTPTIRPSRTRRVQPVYGPEELAVIAKEAGWDVDRTTDVIAGGPVLAFTKDGDEAGARFDRRGRIIDASTGGTPLGGQDRFTTIRVYLVSSDVILARRVADRAAAAERAARAADALHLRRAAAILGTYQELAVPARALPLVLAAEDIESGKATRATR